MPVNKINMTQAKTYSENYCLVVVTDKSQFKVTADLEDWKNLTSALNVLQILVH